MTDATNNHDHNHPDRPDPGTITRLLDQAREGDDTALNEAWNLLYHELRSVAHNLMRGEAIEKQVDATELIAEVWLRGHKDKELPKDRKQFFGRAFRHMSQKLIELARNRDALKRGGGWKRQPFEVAAGELSSIAGLDEEKRVAAAALMAHWQALHEELPETGNVAFCRLVLFLSCEETAQTLDLEPKQVRKEWEFARARLRVAMKAA